MTFVVLFLAWGRREEGASLTVELQPTSNDAPG